MLSASHQFAVLPVQFASIHLLSLKNLVSLEHDTLPGFGSLSPFLIGLLEFDRGGNSGRQLVLQVGLSYLGS